MDKFKEIRPIALGVARKDNKILVGEGYEKYKDETFYRALGGGIEFGETAVEALKREFLEEINVKIKINGFLGISENIFTFHQKKAHEIILFYDITIPDEEYKEEYYIVDTNREFKAKWVDIDCFLNNEKILYPKEVFKYLNKQKEMPKLNTKRLRLRKFELKDLEDVYEYASDDEVTKYLIWDTHKDKLETKQYLESVLQRYKKEQSPYAIVLKENNKVIGCIDGKDYDKENKSIEIGYVLNRNYWNKGIMTEALQELVKYHFSSLDLERIEMRHYKENIASGRVMQKNGFQKEGLLRKKESKNGKLFDVVYYSLLKEEYERAQTSKRD